VESLLSTLCENQSRDRRMVELSGATNMLEYPEYSDVQKAKTFLAAVEQKDDMYRMLKKASNMEFTVTIGSENEQEGFRDCSVVTASYRVNGTPLGSFGVIGPTRMDYARVLTILKNVQSNISTVLQSFLKEE
jgi:heat-inducible transcriptional repressor